MRSPRKIEARSRRRSGTCCSPSSTWRGNARSMLKARCRKPRTNLWRDSTGWRMSCEGRANGSAMLIFLRWTRFGMRSSKRPTPNVQRPTLNSSELDVGRWALSVCFCCRFRDISRPDESSDQPAAVAFCTCVGDHGVSDPDATSKERRPVCGIWRRGHGKYLWRADYQRAGEVDHMASRHFVRSVVCYIEPYCALEHLEKRFSLG